MPYLDIEPDELRRMAAEHEAAAARIRKWGEIPHTWLAEFAPSYGTIADPVRAALADYYQQRHDKAELRAADHERTRDSLLLAADRMEAADRDGGQHVDGAGSRVNQSVPNGPASRLPTDSPIPGSAPVVPASTAPMMNGTQPSPPSATTPTAPGIPATAGNSGQVPSALPGGPLSPTSSPVPASAVPAVSLPIPVSPEPAVSVGPAVSRPPTDNQWQPGAVDVPLPPSAGSSVAEGSAGVISGPPAAAPVPPPFVGNGENAAPRSPTPLPAGPLAASIHVDRSKQFLPKLIVGERVEEDAVLARTLLAAVLAAVGGAAPGLEWATAVLRTPRGPILLLTSNEGRGWLPPGLFLPEEVALPWKWERIFAGAARQAVSALEGQPDPARILAEFALVVPRRRGVRISALASSAAISDDLCATLGDDIPVEGRVSAADSAVDLSTPGAGLADRLALAGSEELLRRADVVPEADIRAECLELAKSADATVRAALRAGDGRPGFPNAETLRSAGFERRVDEMLVLLDSGEPNRQTLRDVLYAYGQISEHPLLPAVTPAVTATEVGAAPALDLSRHTDRAERVPSASFPSVGLARPSSSW